MTTLRASSAVFQPAAPISLDAFLASLLQPLPDYYIKGGKAFNHYYPQDPVATVDTDIVATPAVCDYLFYHLNGLLGKTIRIETMAEPFMVYSCAFKDETYLDEDPNGSARPLRVLSFLVNEISVLDVILQDEIDEMEIEIGENGLRYMAKVLFKQDVAETYRRRILRSETKSKKSKTRRKRHEKEEKSRERVERIKKYGGVSSRLFQKRPY